MKKADLKQELYTKIKDGVEYERFHNAVKNDPTNVLRYVDEKENDKLFGTKQTHPFYYYPNTQDRFRTEIDEAKNVLAMFDVPAYKFVGTNDIDELRSMMYGIEHGLLKVIKNRKLIKDIFNNEEKSLEDKAEELHRLYLECKSKM